MTVDNSSVLRAPASLFYEIERSTSHSEFLSLDDGCAANDFTTSIDRGVLQAQSFCYEMAKSYWVEVKSRTKVKWKFRRLPFILPKLDEYLFDKLHKDKDLIRCMSPENAGYYISLQYQNLLPKAYREKFGIYYTPMHVVERMLDDAQKLLDIDLKKAHVIDPSSGGAAYLAPLCRRMVNKNYSNYERIKKDIESRLMGIEIDPFAAWFSQYLVDCVLAEVAPSKTPPKNILKNANSLMLSQHYYNKFDYVIGNPPYGIINISENLESKYADVVSGKINLYQLFFKLGLNLAKKGGVVHFVTPTGFISGSYFRHLREYLEEHSSPEFFQFFDSRTSIFKGVQQEIAISAFKKCGNSKIPVSMTLEESDSNQKIINKYVTKASSFESGVWILPKSEDEHKAAKYYSDSKYNLETSGFSVRTGYLVPHRTSERISNRKTKLAIPIIWSEAISDGKFLPEISFSKGRERWYTPLSKAGVYCEEAVLVKRTSSKEQKRRIHTAKVARSFITKYKGFVVENHVNVITIKDTPCVSLSVLEKFMRSDIFDDLFRCGSGTVTVSATELRRIPFPSPKGLRFFADFVGCSNDKDIICEAAKIAYMEFC